ncbi:MAG: magnesium transporter [Bacilli bacterium]|jgi:magnesium transporter
MINLDFSKSNYSLKRELKNLPPYDIAALFPELEVEEWLRIFQLIGVKKSSIVFSRLSKNLQMEVFDELEEGQKRQILDHLEVDELKEFIGFYQEEEQAEILTFVKEDKANIIKDLLIYSKHLAPSIMTTEFLIIDLDYSVKQATSYLFNNVKENDFIDNVYVLDDEEKIVGVIALKDLIIARAGDSISNLLDRDFHFVYHDNTVKEAIEVVRNYDLTSLAVIDHQGNLLGIITADDVLEQLMKHYDELYRSLAFLPKSEDPVSGLHRSLKRLPWLIVTTIISLVIATIFLLIPAFEMTLAEVFALVLFQPLVLDMAGNIGTQNLAVTILGIHKEELASDTNRRKYLRKEVLIALLNSLTIAVLGFVVVAVFSRLTGQVKQTGELIAPYKLGLVVGSALFAGMFISALLGTLLPLFFTKRKVDSDNASGPVLTTLADVIALLTYYLIAAIMLLVI